MNYLTKEQVAEKYPRIVKDKDHLDEDGTLNHIVVEKNGVWNWEEAPKLRERMLAMERLYGLNLNNMSCTLALLSLRGSKQHKELYRRLGHTLDSYEEFFYENRENNRYYNKAIYILKFELEYLEEHREFWENKMNKNQINKEFKFSYYLDFLKGVFYYLYEQEFINNYGHIKGSHTKLLIYDFLCSMNYNCKNNYSLEMYWEPNEADNREQNIIRRRVDILIYIDGRIRISKMTGCDFELGTSSSSTTSTEFHWMNEDSFHQQVANAIKDAFALFSE